MFVCPYRLQTSESLGGETVGSGSALSQAIVAFTRPLTLFPVRAPFFFILYSFFSYHPCRKIVPSVSHLTPSYF